MLERKVNEEIVNKVQNADYTLRGLKASSLGLLEAHTGSADVSVLQSKLFKELQVEIGKAEDAFAAAKEEMLRATFSEDEMKKVGEWSLSYSEEKIMYIELVR